MKRFIAGIGVVSLLSPSVSPFIPNVQASNPDPITIYNPSTDKEYAKTISAAAPEYKYTQVSTIRGNDIVPTISVARIQDPTGTPVCDGSLTFTNESQVSLVDETFNNDRFCFKATYPSERWFNISNPELNGKTFYKLSDVISGIDQTPPQINVGPVSAFWEKSKTVTATTNEGTLFYFTQETNETTIPCPSPTVENRYIPYPRGGITFTSEADNGKRVCFKATDEVGNIGYVKSPSIKNIDTTPPIIQISGPSGHASLDDSVSASTNEGTLEAAILKYDSDRCDASASFIDSNRIDFNNEDDTGSRVCFRSVDNAGNTTYEVSNPVIIQKDYGTQNPPSLNIQNPNTNFEKSKTVVGVSEYPVKYKIQLPSDSCDGSSDFSTFTDGDTVTLTSESDNGKRICFYTEDQNSGLSDVMPSQVIQGIDTTPPTLTVQNPDNTPSTSKVVSVQGTDPVTNSNVTLGNVTVPATQECNGTLRYNNGGSVTLTNPNENGRKVCFKGTDVAGNVSYTASNIIQGIEVPAPEITIINPSTTPERSKQILASTNKGILHYKVLDNGSQSCDSTTTGFQAANSEKNSSLTLDAESYNNKAICYMADDQGSKAYKKSDIIGGIDRTPPVLTVQNPNPFAQTDKTVSASATDLNTVTIEHKLLTPGDVCDLSSTGFTTGNTKTFSTEADNGKRVCFKATDVAGNASVRESIVISNIDRTPPTIDIINPSTDKEQTKQVSGIPSEGDIAHVLVNGTTTCDGSLNYTPGGYIQLTDESANGKKVCYKAEDAIGNVVYKASDIIQGLDTKAPIITIDQDATPEPVKQITATTNEGVLTYVVLDKGDRVCDDSQYFEPYKDLTFSSPNDNGKSICYRAEDEVGHITFKLSNPIAGITLPTPDPITIDVITPNNKPAKQKEVTATASEGTLSYSVVSLGTTCDDRLNYTPYNTKVVLTSETDNNKKVCFKAETNDGRKKFENSRAISGIDTTPPTVAISFHTENGSLASNDRILRTKKIRAIGNDEDNSMENVEVTVSVKGGPFENPQKTQLDYLVETEEFNGTVPNIRFKVTDEAGNETIGVPELFDGIDRTNPVINITYPKADEYQTVKQIIGTAVDKNHESLEGARITIDGVCDETNTSLRFTVTTPTSYTGGYNKESDNGVGAMCFKARDLAGNITYKKSEAVKLIDVTGPKIAITGPADGNARSKTIEGVATDDPNPGVSTLGFTVIPKDSECSTALSYVTGSTVIANTSWYNDRKVCFIGKDSLGNLSFKESDVITGIDDSVPEITINPVEHDLTKERTISATATVPDLKYAVLEPNSNLTCEDPSLNYVTGSTITFVNEEDNLKRVCFKATNSVGTETFKMSDQVWEIDNTAPKLTTTLSPDSPTSVSRTVTASTDNPNDDTVSYVVIDKDEQCTVDLNFANQGTRVEFTSETDNNKKVCFKAEDKIGNISVEESPVITGIDTTPPTIDVKKEDKPTLTYTATTPNGDRITHAIIPAGSDQTCEDPYLAYNEGHEVSFNKESDNGSKVCFRASDDAGNETITSVIVGGIDSTPPTIVINNPDTTPAREKIVEAESDEGELTYSITDNDVCNSTLTFTTGKRVVFNKESDNGKRVCYKAVDDQGNSATKLSEPISGIDLSDPEITVINPDTTPAPIKEVIGTTNEGNLSYSIVDKDDVCRNVVNWTVGDRVTLTNESENNKKVCFKATDDAGNIGYGESDPIKGIDTTPLTLEITNPDGTPEKTKTVTADAGDGEVFYFVTDANDTCTANMNYEKGKTVTFNKESDNGRKVCFKATDEHGTEIIKESNPISGIDRTKPVIDVTNPNTTTPELSKIVIGTLRDPIVKEFNYSIENQCDDNSKYNISYTSGDLIILDSVSYNNKKVCFKAVDHAGNIGYGESEVIENIVSELPKYHAIGKKLGYRTIDFTGKFTYSEGLTLTIKENDKLIQTYNLTDKGVIEERFKLSTSPAIIKYQYVDKKGRNVGDEFIENYEYNLSGGEILTPVNKSTLEHKEYEVTGVGIENKAFEIYDKETNKSIGKGTTNELGEWKVTLPQHSKNTITIKLHVDNKETNSEKTYNFNIPVKSSGGGGGSAPTKIEIKKDCRVVGNCDEPKKEEPKTETKVETPKKETIKDDYKVYNGTRYKHNSIDKCDRIVRYPNASTISSFRDIYDSYAKQYIGKFYNVDVVVGTTPSTFEPTRNITRAEFLAIVLKAHCIDPSPYVNVGDIPFTDVDLNTWQARVIKRAYEEKIISGYQPIDGKVLVKPNSPISKIEALTVLIRMEKISLDANKGYNHGYNDLKAEWQNEIATIAERLDLVKDRGTLNPDFRISREWMIDTMNNLVTRYNEK